ncbi:astacin-like metalloprotease toxin 5 [Galendromus occidentalis]|uniref:Metalloendopeptidase n=1 Tax=Galendromus occidentalis TaxID=34638 RepID=A0AAJ6QNR2_9ACAR|nr:astacin-like metalloprotease toxin 5 [Galendromus occidentalis]
MWMLFSVGGASGFFSEIEKSIVEAFKEYFPMENKNLIEGDIIPDARESLSYNAMTSESKRWYKGLVPYVIDSSLRPMEPLIQEAMKNIQTRTACIRFKPRSGERDFILIKKGKGCNSYVGRQGGQQEVSIGEGCESFGVVVHELTHSLGFHHEHNRSDRDQYIKIYMENIDPQYGSQFRKKSPNENRLINAFSYDSIMLYGSKSFSKSKRKPSMTKLNGETLTEVHHKKGLSKSDVERIRKLYSC